MVSIIVPVYNCEKYLDRCVSSVVAQTLEDWELILVDDGSTDGSGESCDRWAVRDSRIRVIHQPNRGASAARNAGLDAATGDWIGFVDGDDHIEDQTYALALDAAADAEIVMWDAVTVWPDGRTEPDTIPLLAEDTLLTRQDWTPELLCQMAGSVCRCLYRAALIRDIRFPAGIKFSEDRLFNLQAMGRAGALRYLKKAWYRRRIHGESVVHRYHEDHFETCKAAHTAVMEVVIRDWGEEYILAYNRQFIGGAQGAIHNYFYKTSPLTGCQQREKVRTLCNDPELRRVLEETPDPDFRSRLMHSGQVWALCLLAQLANWKHGR